MSAPPKHVAVVGGGLAGMSAAVALAQAGYRVSLLEKRAAPGGRAGSHFEASTGEWIDGGQHVLMPCCTNLLDFYRRIGAERRIRFYSEIPFLTSGGRISVLRSGRLPAPFHCLPSFLALHFLRPGEKLRIAAGLASFRQLRGNAAAGRMTAGEWLRQHGQTPRTMALFWHPVIASALNEEPDRASAAFAAKVFFEAFLSNSRGWWLGIPTVPLGLLYHPSVGDVLEGAGGRVRLRTAARSLEFGDGRICAVLLDDGQRLEADQFVLAVPWHAARRLWPETAPGRKTLDPLDLFEATPITGIHLWLDRSVTSMDFAALPGKSFEWFFNKSRNYEGMKAEGCHLLLMSSASRAWLRLGKGGILNTALRDLADVLPSSRNARILKSRVFKEPAATFSPGPITEDLRPAATTGIHNLFLAGDWIQTGWPATMESAVRAGYLAAEAVLAADGAPQTLLVRDLEPSGWMRAGLLTPGKDADPTRRSKTEGGQIPGTSAEDAGVRS